MSQTNDEQQQQRDVLDVNSHSDHLSPLSNRFLVAHSSPVHESTNEFIPPRHPDDSFQSSSSNSKSSSSAHSHTSRLHYLMMQHQSAVNSPLAYSRCTSLGSLSSFDIRSSCNESYTSECSSIKPSGLISPSDIPDSPPCEPEILEEEDEDEEEHQQKTKPINRTLTMNTTSSLGRTTMMGETVIEKTFVLHQQEIRTTNHIEEDQEIDDDEHLDEVIVYAYDTSEMNKISYNNEILFDDDSYRVFSSQTDEHNSSIDENSQNQASFNVPSHENLSVITEESSFIEVEEMNSNDENNSIKILYDLIKKPHWTKKTSNTSLSSDPSSLSLNSFNGHSSDDEDEYDQEKGQQLIQRLIEETLARRSLRTDYLRTTSCTHCPSNTPLTTDTRSITSSSTSSSSSSSVSAKSCSCTGKYLPNSNQPQRSQSSPARTTSRQKENLIHHTRTSFLRLRQAQQNKRLNNPDKRI